VSIHRKADFLGGYLLYYRQVVAALYFGGVGLASSRGSSNGPDVRDVAAIMLAFEHINSCRLSLRVGIAGDARHLGLRFELEAWPKETESGEVKPLASAKSLTGYKDRRTVEVVITQLMYSLDAQMAEEEFEKAAKQKA